MEKRAKYVSLFSFMFLTTVLGTSAYIFSIEPVQYHTTNSHAATAPSSFLFGSNLGMWGATGNGSINEPVFSNPNETNDAKGVVTVFRFPARNLTDAQLLTAVADIRAMGAEPLCILSATNIPLAVHVAQLLNGKVKYFEFGNEDNWFNSWTGTQYATAWKTGVPQVRAVNPSAFIGGPVVSYIAKVGGTNTYLDDFLNNIKGNTSIYPDFISAHIYSLPGSFAPDATVMADVATWSARINVVQNDVTTILGKSLPTAITEWNWNGTPENPKSPDTRDTNAVFMHSFTYAAFDQLRAANVWMANEYDFGSGAGGGHLDMVNTSGTIKPQYTEFKNYEATAGAVTITPTVTSTPPTTTIPVTTIPVTTVPPTKSPTPTVSHTATPTLSPTATHTVTPTISVTTTTHPTATVTATTTSTSSSTPTPIGTREPTTTSTPTPTPAAVKSNVVITKTNNTPLSNAVVTVKSSTGSVTTTTTDQNGSVTLPSGDTIQSVSNDGVSIPINQTLNSDESYNVTVDTNKNQVTKVSGVKTFNPILLILGFLLLLISIGGVSFLYRKELTIKIQDLKSKLKNKNL